MMKFVIAAALCTSLTAMASAQDADERLYKSVTQADLETVASSSGHTITQRGTEKPSVYGENEDGLKYSLSGTACTNNSPCLGVNMTVSYDLPAGMSLDDLNRADVKFAAVSVWQQENSIGVSRYVIMDGGMTMENLRVNLKILLQIAPQVLTIAGEDATATSTNTSDIDFGDDSGSYANDGDCDDARFHDDGADWNFKQEHIRHDATDCRAKVAAGEIAFVRDYD